MHIQILQKGSILIARPSLLTDIFHRSVVILVNYSDQTGSIGFVLNKSLEIPVNVFLGDLNSDNIVYSGGPVEEENIFYLHKRPDLIKDSEHIQGDLYWSGSFDDVKHAVNNGFIQTNEIKFYVGYSGWSQNQLDDEVKNGAWNVINDREFDLFSDLNHNLWKDQMKQLGGENLLCIICPKILCSIKPIRAMFQQFARLIL